MTVAPIAASWLKRSDGAPLVYGHRGARGELPENSMPSFEHLIANRIAAVEIDVQNAAGRIPVLHHDPRISVNLARDRVGRWLEAPGPKIVDLGYEELRDYDVGTLKPGTEYHGKFAAQRALDRVRVPTLAEFCGWLGLHSDLAVNIEVKSYADRDDLGDTPGVLTLSILETLWSHGVADRVLISSFDWRVLSEFRVRASGVPLGFLTYLDRPEPTMTPNIYVHSPWMDGARWNGDPQAIPEVIRGQGGRVWAPYFRDLSEQDVRRAHDIGLLVNAWTVNDPDDVLRMIDMGVDGLISDYPLRTRGLVDEQRKVI